jgi:thioredoxin-related protein
MKKLFAATMIFMAGLSSGNAQQHSLAIGSSIPLIDQSLQDISGKQITTSSAMGTKGLLVMFSCNTCPYVMRNQARTKQLAKLAKENGIGVLLLNSNEGGRQDGDSFDDMKSYANQQGYDFYYALDAGSRLADAYGASRTPEIFLFDSGGHLKYKGAIDDNPSDASNVRRRHAQEAIAEMLAGREITVKESRSVGCGIKRL